MNIKHRVKTPGTDLNTKKNFDGKVGPVLNRDSLLIEAVSKTGNSYFLINTKNKVQTIAENKGLLSSIDKAIATPVYIFNSEDFERPPSIIIKDLKTDKEKTIYKSNPQHHNFLWGKTELVHYTNSKNKKLDAVLYYPADYDAAKKYPMIVHVYEVWPRLLHQYINPSEYLQDGYNPSNFTAKGYFVLVPDIDYELGNPGLSAADCTIAATREIIRKKLVDSGKIGLMGHSFGGYETNFIITQTNLFAAAISSAGIADFTGHYFSVGWNWGKAEIWRYENQQNRMKKSFFDDKAGYDRNSPVQHADKVNTPILIWAGEEDRQIYYNQSIAFYLALKRNNKKQIMLIYPSEAHVLMKKNNQTENTRRTEEWFDYFLKGDKTYNWITEGIK